MAEKVRIYKLAKDIGIETKEMLDILDEIGVEYKSHSSTLEAETADMVRELVEANDADGAAAGGAEAPARDAPAQQARSRPAKGDRTPEERQAPTQPPSQVEDAAPAAPAASAASAAAGSGTAGSGTAGSATATTTATRPAAAKAEPDPEPKAAAEKRPDLPTRAPVVTIMGHVDHGKTTLLDHIRQTRVAAGEAGGITQHIGAYRAETKFGPVTFLDTPGHEAFTAIRQRGANATDIVVIVVAADDSIMPQTREAIAHAKAAKVPIIVAINKVDLPQANPDKVKQDLMQVDLVPEDFGGDTIVVNISAITGDGVTNLLEMISLVAELEDLRADPDAPMRGVVVESVLDKQAGVLATVLVQQGTLRVGDIIVSGEAWAKVRRLTDHAGGQVKEAGPATPVQVLGFSDQPVAGDVVEYAESDAAAKRITQERIEAREERERESIGMKNVTLADLFGQTKVTTINLILRADTQGTLEAIKGVLQKASEQTEEVDLEIMMAEVGAPTESDLLLASTADATVMSFGVNPPGSVKKAAERQGIPLKTYRIIYDLIEDVERMIRGHIEPEVEERILGHAEVRQVIHVPRSGNIAGSYVTDGVIRRNAKARLTREGREVYKGTISNLRRFKDDVREVGQGFECGINLQNYDNVQEGDIIEAYEMVEVPVA